LGIVRILRYITRLSVTDVGGFGREFESDGVPSVDHDQAVYFVGTGFATRVVRNSSSIIQYGEKTAILQDGRVTTTASADLIANAYLTAHANPEVRTC